MSETKWYVAAMNDALFVIDRPPSPSGTDIPPGVYADVKVIAKVEGNGHADDARNARLIATAPEMAEFIQQQYDATACICGFKAAGYTEMPCTKCGAAKLLAKARGEVEVTA